VWECQAGGRGQQDVCSVDLLLGGLGPCSGGYGCWLTAVAALVPRCSLLQC